jgi:hypothetical protein
MNFRDHFEDVLFAAKVAALSSLAFLFMVLAFLALQVREDLNRTSSGVDVLVQHATTLVDAAKAPVDQSYHVMLNARVAMDNVNKASIDERFYLEHTVPLVTRDVEAVLVSARKSIDGLQGTGQAATAALNETTARLHDLQPVESNAALVLQDVDVVVSDPHIKASLVNIDATSASTSSAAKHLDGAAEDAQTAFHRFLHPAWPDRIVAWGSQAIHALGGWF